MDDPEELPSIEVEPSFQDIAKTADPAKIKEKIRHANEQLELTQHYPGRGRARPRGKVSETHLRQFDLLNR